MLPTIGRIVHYTLTDTDAQLIAKRRADSGGLLVGNPVAAGDTFPAEVVRVFSAGSTSVNLQVKLDGTDTHWATSRGEGEPGQAGFWIWPPRV